MPAYKITTNFKFKNRRESLNTMGGSGHIILDEIQSEKGLYQIEKENEINRGFPVEFAPIAFVNGWSPKKKMYWPR